MSVVVEHAGCRCDTPCGPTRQRVELHAPDGREVVAVQGEEQVVEQVLGRVLGRRLARAHHAVDLDLRLQRGGRVDAQGLGDVGSVVEVVDEQGVQRLDAGLAERDQVALGDLLVGLRQHLAGLGVDHVMGQDAPDQELVRHLQALARRPSAARGCGAAVTRLPASTMTLSPILTSKPTVSPRRRSGTSSSSAPPFLRRVNSSVSKKRAQDLLVAVAERAQQDGHRQLAAAVDAHEDVVLGIELEVQPGAAIGDDPRREQELARGVGLALVVVEEHARRAMQLGDDDPLGAVDDEGAGLGHERQLAHVDLLLLDVLDHLVAAGLLVVDDQAQQHAQRRADR